MELLARMGDEPGPTEIDSLWRSLGVSRGDGEVELDPDAPLAQVRDGIARAAR